MTINKKWTATMDDRVRQFGVSIKDASEALKRLGEAAQPITQHDAPGFWAWLQRQLNIGGYTFSMEIETVNCRCAPCDRRYMIVYTVKPKTLIVDSSTWTGRESI